MATPLLDMPEFHAVSQLGEACAWSTTSRSKESVGGIVGGSLAWLMNLDHSVPR